MARSNRAAPAVPLHELHLPVRRTARLLIAGEPSAAVRQVWIACHGYGQLARDFAHALGALQHPARLIAVPEALNRYYLNDQGGVHGAEHPVGATWMTREDREAEIDDYCAYLDTVHDHVLGRLERASVSVCALGFSQGAQTVSRWAVRTLRRPDHLVLWGAGPAQELQPEEVARAGTKLTLVVGERDTYATTQVLGELVPQLERSGVSFTVERFAGGHRLDDEMLRKLAVLVT